jgi:hypothetical protein
LTLAELAHVIENNEWKIYKESNSCENLTLKEFRHNHPNERAKVVNLLQTAWSQIQSLAVPLDELVIDESTTSAALARFQTQALDGYDLYSYNLSRYGF